MSCDVMQCDAMWCIMMLSLSHDSSLYHRPFQISFSIVCHLLHMGTTAHSYQCLSALLRGNHLAAQTRICHDLISMQLHDFYWILSTFHLDQHLNLQYSLFHLKLQISTGQSMLWLRTTQVLVPQWQTSPMGQWNRDHLWLSCCQIQHKASAYVHSLMQCILTYCTHYHQQENDQCLPMSWLAARYLTIKMQ